MDTPRRPSFPMTIRSAPQDEASSRITSWGTPSLMMTSEVVTIS